MIRDKNIRIYRRAVLEREEKKIEKKKNYNAFLTFTQIKASFPYPTLFIAPIEFLLFVTFQLYIYICMVFIFTKPYVSLNGDGIIAMNNHDLRWEKNK
ncbi:hypothetical protein PUN28_016775 [Cardiocondyla obscurior]|uniref:ATP synthase F0 subunit 8 n=1 Tax=Cardiocondyla obscurior TaxID=286306 RepID=A0AAW2ER22_9HYME